MTSRDSLVPTFGCGFVSGAWTLEEDGQRGNRCTMKLLVLCLGLLATCNCQVIFPSEESNGRTPSPTEIEAVDDQLFDVLSVDERRNVNSGPVQSTSNSKGVAAISKVPEDGTWAGHYL
ncbi:hypothetical protein C7M84_006593 [Penaeus vannamei]|uniref:Uncharacterized protein n=1 Tax=Penaeus vannamei TaxID=6689 RepID=A0A3R7M8G8_PENVA|nr:hypothetical protein C7M84_006593 [Penaeus vannamei]